MVDALGGALLGELVVFAQEGWQLERLEVMGEQKLTPAGRSPHHRGGWKGKHLRQRTCHYPDAKEYAAGGITDRRVRLINRDHSVWQGSWPEARR